jgi:tetratricopeptide (TPR) repeat protein
MMSIKPGRNDPCPCGSGKRYKHCCGQPLTAPAAGQGVSAQQIGALLELLNQERRAEAERGCRALLESYPASGMLWKILAVALVRQGKDSLLALRRAAQLLPEDAETHRILGAALHDRRQWPEALASLQRSLELQPYDPTALLECANALRALRRPRDSLALYRRALQLDARLSEAHNNMGNAYLELGQPGDAAECYRQALALNPDNAQVHFNLASALRELRRLPEAIDSSRRAIELLPGLSAAHTNLGLSLAGLGQRREALACYRQALRLDPHSVEALGHLANVLRELGERKEALVLYRQALDLDPVRAASHCNLGGALLELRQTEEGAVCLQRALQLQPEYPQAQLGLAAALRLQGQADQAALICRAVLERTPMSAEALTLLGELHADRGRFDEAQALWQQAIAVEPDHAPAYCAIAAHRRMRTDDRAWLEAVQALLAKPLPFTQELALRYALGKYCDDLGQYDEAFASYRHANELAQRCGERYDRAKLARHVTRIVSAFDASFVRQRQPGASDSELPVFIVGMPRSGTSLTEQILASHPQVFGAGEVRFWERALEVLDGPSLEPRAAGSVLAGMARDYLERVSARAGEARRIVDKMPANFLCAGLIHAVFPRARIIHMQRHPLDTCVSIYSQNFLAMEPYANDLENLAHYYGEYRRITAHWRAVFGSETLLEVPYEGLIAEQEAWTRRMLNFIGVPWDPQCLEFHRTERSVLGASRWQVRQRISAASAGRWRHYEKHLGALRGLIADGGRTRAAGGAG